MTRNVNWPGRGPTWIAVPALVAMLFGGLTLLEILSIALEGPGLALTLFLLGSKILYQQT